MMGHECTVPLSLFSACINTVRITGKAVVLARSNIAILKEQWPIMQTLQLFFQFQVFDNQCKMFCGSNSRVPTTKMFKHL